MALCVLVQLYTTYVLKSVYIRLQHHDAAAGSGGTLLPMLHEDTRLLPSCPSAHHSSLLRVFTYCGSYCEAFSRKNPLPRIQEHYGMMPQLLDPCEIYSLLGLRSRAHKRNRNTQEDLERPCKSTNPCNRPTRPTLRPPHTLPQLPPHTPHRTTTSPHAIRVWAAVWLASGLTTWSTPRSACSHEHKQAQFCIKGYLGTRLVRGIGVSVHRRSCARRVCMRGVQHTADLTKW